MVALALSEDEIQAVLLIGPVGGAVGDDIVEFAKGTVVSVLEEFAGKKKIKRDKLLPQLEEALTELLVGNGADDGDVVTLCSRIADKVCGEKADKGDKKEKKKKKKGDEKDDEEEKEVEKAGNDDAEADNAGKNGGAADADDSTAPSSKTSSKDKQDEKICCIENLILMYGGGKLLLKNTTLELARGHRYGIVGENGAGKTTLMNLIARGGIEQLPLDKFRIVSVQHEIVSDPSEEITVCDFAKKTSIQNEEKMKKLHYGGTEARKKAESGEKFGLDPEDALRMVGFIDADAGLSPKKAANAPAEPEEVEVDANGDPVVNLAHVTQLSWNKFISELSGGWRMRLALAIALMQDASPDVLMLDEPTNHLDVQAVQWLSDYLCSQETLKRSAIIIITHDRGFLNTACSDIIHFHDHKLGYYKGNFEKFKVQFVKEVQAMKSDSINEHLKTLEKEMKVSFALGEDEMEKTTKADESQSGNESVVSTSQVKLAPGEYGKDATTKESEWMGCMPTGGLDKLQFPLPGKLEGITNDRKAIIELKKIDFAYPLKKAKSGEKGSEESGEKSADVNPDGTEKSENVLENLSCRLTLSSRVAVVGKNGAGKSTLMSLLSGELGLDDGATYFKHRNLRLAYIAQHHTFHLKEYLQSPPLIYMQKRFKNGYDEELQVRLLSLEPEEEEFVVKMANRYGKYGKRVKDFCGRQKRGKELYYEVEWEGLDDSKQNTFEPLSKLRLMGVENIVKAYDERMQAVAAGNDQRPLSTREIVNSIVSAFPHQHDQPHRIQSKIPEVNHFSKFAMEENMVCERHIGSFSMGQKSRLTLAAAMWIKPHCLMLDEPTNYIDQETLDALIRALKFFRGALLVISHKKEFLDAVCSETWLVENKSLAASKRVK